MDQATASLYNLAPMPPSRLNNWGRRLHDIAGFFLGLIKMSFYGFLMLAVLGIIGIFGASSSASLIERRELKSGNTSETIAVVGLSGTIVEDVSSNPLDLGGGEYITPRMVSDLLREIKSDDAIVALVLRINSPGGTVTASEEIYQELVRFKSDTGLPIIASYSEMAASGGYYISLPADYIVANATTLTGSIGAIISSYNYKKLADTYGVSDVTIASGPNKDLLNPLKEVDVAQREVLQNVVDEAYQQFSERIKSHRSISVENFARLADGRVLTGKQAVAAGFVDQVGTLYDAIAKAESDAYVYDPRVVEFRYGGLISSVLGVISRPFINLDNLALGSMAKIKGKVAYYYNP